jgi:hypothetical protein
MRCTISTDGLRAPYTKLLGGKKSRGGITINAPSHSIIFVESQEEKVMNYSIFRFTLNMHSHRSQASVSAFQGDTAVRLLITLTDGGVPYKIEGGCVAMLTGTKADGKKLAHRCTILNDMTTIQYDFEEQTSSFAGVVNCEIALYGADGKTICAPKFTIVIDERETTDLNLSTDDENLLASIALAEAQREAAEAERVRAEELRQTGNLTDKDKEAIVTFVNEMIVGGEW